MFSSLTFSKFWKFLLSCILFAWKRRRWKNIPKFLVLIHLRMLKLHTKIWFIILIHIFKILNIQMLLVFHYSSICNYTEPPLAAIFPSLHMVCLLHIHLHRTPLLPYHSCNLQNYRCLNSRHLIFCCIYCSPHCDIQNRHLLIYHTWELKLMLSY